MTITSQLEAALEAYPGRGDLCGAIRASRDGEVLLERALGQASAQLDVDNRPGTRFHIASMTKMFISAAVVRMADDGALSLQAHPSAYLPALAVLDRRITLHQLLCHMSGLADVYDAPDLALDMAKLVKRKGRLLDYLIARPHRFEPGTRWAYSSTGFLLLAYVLEQAAGSPFDDLVAEMFLRPLGMSNTGPDDPYRVNPGRAGGQNGRDGVWENAPNDALAGVEAPQEFYSTVADLDRWGTGLLNGEVLGEAGMRLTFSPHARIGPDSGFDPGLSYGYGWFLGPGYRWIGGRTGGFRSAMWQYPDERLNVVMLWNNERVDSQRVFGALRPILFG